MRLLIPYAQVQGDLTGWVAHFNEQIEWVRERKECRIQDLPLSLIARAILGRPDVDPNGPTRFDVLAPLLNTDTKSHVDMLKIYAHTAADVATRIIAYTARFLWWDGYYPVPTADNAIILGFSDGQSNKLEGHGLNRTPALARNRVPIDGPMHAYAHALFGTCEMFYSTFTCSCARLLCREKIREMQQDLENNSLKNHQEFMNEIYVGATAYILQNVTNPPPELWISDPDEYIARVQHQGAKVVLEYIR
jgi:hypothetical protein